MKPKIIWKIVYRKVRRKKGHELEYAKYKSAALHLAENRISHFNKFYQFTINKVTIKNQSSRWGSCSKKGNLNFNYKIAKLPQELADYVIVHELCHLKEFNHSPAFWNLVAQTIPNHKAIRKQFKKIQL